MMKPLDLTQLNGLNDETNESELRKSSCMRLIMHFLILRMADAALEQQATERGIGCVHRLDEVVEVLLQLQDVLPQKRGAALRLADWFVKREAEPHVLPMNPRASRPIPPHSDK